jgi:hypothetical protein
VAELVDVPGATLWTASQGAGVPLVLCHGGPGLSDNVGPVAAMVDDVARVHASTSAAAAGRARTDRLDVDAMIGDLEACAATGATSAGSSAAIRGARASRCSTRSRIPIARWA